MARPVTPVFYTSTIRHLGITMAALFQDGRVTDAEYAETHETCNRLINILLRVQSAAPVPDIQRTSGTRLPRPPNHAKQLAPTTQPDPLSPEQAVKRKAKGGSR